MKYIKTKSEYTSQNVVNEEFLGGLIKNLFTNIKSKIAVSISKNIGSVAEIDKLLSEYKTNLLKLMEPKRTAIKEITEMQLAIDNGGEGSLDELKKLVGKYTSVVTNVDAQVKNSKDQFDAKVAIIVKNEKNPLVNDYITLKKFDMTQEILQMELGIINNDSGLSKEQIEKSETLNKMNTDLTNKAKEVNKAKEELEKTVSTKSHENNGTESATPSEFDQEEAKKDKNYTWNSKFSNGDYIFSPGEEIKYWSNGSSSVKDAFVVNPEDANLTRKPKDNELIINTKKDTKSGSFPISKGKVVSTTKNDLLKEKEAPTQGNEDDNNDKSNDI